MGELKALRAVKTGKITSETYFFGNRVCYGMILDDLRLYLKELSKFLDNRSRRLERKSRLQTGYDFEQEAYLLAYQDFFPRVLHDSFLVSLVSLLEQEIDDYCTDLQRLLVLKLRWTELKGSFLERCKKYTLEVAHLPVIIDSKLWDDIQALVEVRNAIVHSSGILDKSSRAKTILQLSERYPSLSILSGCICPSVTFCNQMVNVVYNFLEVLTRTAYEYFKPRRKNS